MLLPLDAALVALFIAAFGLIIILGARSLHPNLSVVTLIVVESLLYWQLLSCATTVSGHIDALLLSGLQVLFGRILPRVSVHLL